MLFFLVFVQPLTYHPTSGGPLFCRSTSNTDRWWYEQGRQTVLRAMKDYWQWLGQLTLSFFLCC